MLVIKPVTASGTPPIANVSAYSKVKDFLKSGLESGLWSPDALMPSEANLVEQFRVSRMTVNRALKELQAEGLVRRVQGVGTFAAQLGRISTQLTIRDIHEDIEARGHTHTTQVKLLREEHAEPSLAQQMGMRENAKVFHSVLLHLENGKPLQVEDRFVNPAWAPDYLTIDFTNITPTAYLLQVAPLWQAQYLIEAGRCTPAESNWLQIGADTPCLIIVRRTMNRGLPITLVRLVHPGACYQIEGSFSP